jgi:hypothetical protein
MRVARVCFVLVLSIVAGTAIYQSFMAKSVSAQFPDPCSPNPFPTGCFKFDSQTASCCAGGTFVTTGQILTGPGNQASVMQTTQCDGGGPKRRVILRYEKDENSPAHQTRRSLPPPL